MIPVITPSGAIAKSMLSAHPMDSLKNCFATCSPNNARIGARSLKRLFARSSPSSARTEGMREQKTIVEANSVPAKQDNHAVTRLRDSKGKILVICR